MAMKRFRIQSNWKANSPLAVDGAVRLFNHWTCICSAHYSKCRSTCLACLLLLVSPLSTAMLYVLRETH